MARGSLKKIRDGTWWGRIDVPSIDKKRRQLTKTFRVDTQKEAEKQFNSWVAEVQNKYKDYHIITVEKLFEIYFSNYCERQLKIGKLAKSTFDWYGYTSRRIIQNLGYKKIDSVTFDELEEFFAIMAEEDLSEKYVYEHFNLLKTVFNYAVVKDLLLKNTLHKYAKALGFSKKPEGKVKVFEGEEVSTIIKESSSNKILFTTVNIVKNAGLRRGETLGLQLKHVNFKDKIISVQQQLQKNGKEFEITKPKTERGIRTIPMTNELEIFLHKHILERKKQILALGFKPSQDDFIIANELNQPVDPNYATRRFRELMEKLDEKEKQAGRQDKFAGRGLHCLRHTFASNMIKAGVDVIDLSALLGHHAPSFTMDVYGHIFHDSKRKAVSKYEKFMAERSDFKTAEEENVL